MPPASAPRLARISIRGVVQGVGFRPFVYQLALRFGLKGWVCNTSGDVKIEIEGSSEAVQQFLAGLRREAPPRSRIEKMSVHHGQPTGYTLFEIKESLSEQGAYQLISPDLATCGPCIAELFDPTDRRYHYPFINCTDCGPRLTIIQDIPYDRPNTTMRAFRMCPACQKEYEDPLNRRFHAQPNCCAQCGPRLELTDPTGMPLESHDPIADAAKWLKEGKIIALKGIGGFLLACDATDEAVVQRLRERKKRRYKPFALMMPSLQRIKETCFVSTEEETLLTSEKSPIVLLKKRNENLVAPGVAPHLKYLGVMLPYTPLHHVLMHEVGLPLVMTSGNLSEEPIVGQNEEAVEKLAALADNLLWHNRDIYAPCDDSVTMVEDGQTCILRRARGYAPQPIRLPFETCQVLACGAEFKNTFCMTKDEYAFVSQHVGDMDNYETLVHFEKMLHLYRRLFRLDPVVVAYDMHPDYLATRYARELLESNDALTGVPVQHHHAHIVSCMVENGITKPVLGVAFDGTGYGEDGTIWGGEFLLVEYEKFTRLAHLEYVPLPGGDAAVKRPYRMAVSYLLTLLGEETLSNTLEWLKGIRAEEIDLIKTQVIKKINAPVTSSAGRLFDAVSSLIGIRQVIDYEGQAAIELEMAATDAGPEQRGYPFHILKADGNRVVRLNALFSSLLEDIHRGVPKATMAWRFHFTVAELISQACQTLSREHGLDHVALSGGVFQNRLLLKLTKRALQEMGLHVLTHRDLPCNDGCISLGQAVIAGSRIKNPPPEHTA